MNNRYIEQLKRMTDEVIVACSGGKDSTVTLDLCVRSFKRVEVYYLYLVKDLEFVEETLQRLERRYDIKIYRLPSFFLSHLYKYAVYRKHSWKAMDKTPKVTRDDVDRFVRLKTGIQWIAKGLKKADNLERRGYLTKIEGIDFKKAAFFPLTDWTHKEVYSYLLARRIPLPPDYLMFGRSWTRLDFKSLSEISTRYPSDYRKIIEIFPFAEAEMKRFEFYGKTDSRREYQLPSLKKEAQSR